MYIVLSANSSNLISSVPVIFFSGLIALALWLNKPTLLETGKKRISGSLCDRGRQQDLLKSALLTPNLATGAGEMLSG